MTDRREDDQLDPITGIPVSAAHEAIYAHIGECKEDLLVAHQSMVDEIDARYDTHIRERHHPPLNEIAEGLGKTPGELMSSFIRSIEISDRIVDALDGPEISNLDGTTHREPKDGMIWQVKDVQTQLRNGVMHKRAWTTGQWTFAGTALTVLGGILAVLIGGGG